MRFHELVNVLESDYQAEIRDEAINLLVAAKAQGVETIGPLQLIKTLKAQGYDLDLQTLIDLLQDHPMIEMITPEKIVVSTGALDRYVDPNTANKEDAKIKKMAKRQIDKELK